MANVVGLDLSLTSTGVAIVTGGAVALQRVRSTGKKVDDLSTRWVRIRQLVNDVEHHCKGADLVVIEQPAFSRQVGHMHDRSGFWWLVVDRLRFAGVPVAEVSPTTLKKYAIGKGGGSDSGKDAVLAAVIRRYPDVNVTGNDEADALVLAAMGSRHAGQPIDDMPKTHLAAMDAVRWPENARGGYL